MTPPPEKNEQADQGVGPARDAHELNPLSRSVEKAVTELQTARVFIERELEQGRSDIRDVRDRLARLETKVADLPSKSWIGMLVVGGMTFLSALVAVLAKVFGH